MQVICTHLLCCCLLALAVMTLAVMLPRLRCRTCMRAAHTLVNSSNAWLHGLTCILKCMSTHASFACVIAWLVEQESKTMELARPWSSQDHGATPRASNTLEQHPPPPPSCSLALSRSASRHADASIPEALLLHALALHMRALSTKTWLVAWGVDSVDTRYTHTRLTAHKSQ